MCIMFSLMIGMVSCVQSRMQSRIRCQTGKLDLCSDITGCSYYNCRYIPERMRMSAVEARVQTLIETDWKAKAEELLEQRRRAGEHDVSTARLFQGGLF